MLSLCLLFLLSLDLSLESLKRRLPLIKSQYWQALVSTGVLITWLNLHAHFCANYVQERSQSLEILKVPVHLKFVRFCFTLRAGTREIQSLTVVKYMYIVESSLSRASSVPENLWHLEVPHCAFSDASLNIKGKEPGAHPGTHLLKKATHCMTIVYAPFDRQIQLKWAMAQSIICKTALSTCFAAEGGIGEVIQV